MKTFLSCLLGAVLWAVVGAAAAVLFVAFRSDGNDFGDAFAAIGLVPFGLVLGAIVGVVLTLKVRGYAADHWEGRQAKRKTSLIVTSFILAAPLFVTMMLWEQQQLRRPPSDRQLLSNFQRHQKEFDTLARMTQADKDLRRVDYNWTDPGDPQAVGVSATRIRVYRRLLDDVRCHRGFNSYQDHGTEFQYWGHGSAISDDEDKGYAYLTVPPKQVLNSLDDCQPDEANVVQAYCHITGCWYLYYDYLPG